MTGAHLRLRNFHLAAIVREAARVDARSFRIAPIFCVAGALDPERKGPTELLNCFKPYESSAPIFGAYSKQCGIKRVRKWVEKLSTISKKAAPAVPDGYRGIMFDRVLGKIRKNTSSSSFPTTPLVALGKRSAPNNAKAETKADHFPTPKPYPTILIESISGELSSQCLTAFSFRFGATLRSVSPSNKRRNRAH